MTSVCLPTVWRSCSMPRGAPRTPSAVIPATKRVIDPHIGLDAWYSGTRRP
jgi:hypothetical protein